MCSFVLINKKNAVPNLDVDIFLDIICCNTSSTMFDTRFDLDHQAFLSFLTPLNSISQRNLLQLK